MSFLRVRFLKKLHLGVFFFGVLVLIFVSLIVDKFIGNNDIKVN